MPKTYVYWNLHKNIWSKMVRGKVIGHSNSVCLTGVDFRVRPGGRARVLREHKKNVHAFCVGKEQTLSPHDLIANLCLGPSGVEVRYNPYEHGSFVRMHGGNDVHRADIAVLTKDRRVFAYGVS